MCVYMYVYACTCVCVQVYVFVYVCAYTCMQVCVCWTAGHWGGRVKLRGIRGQEEAKKCKEALLPEI